MKIFCLNEKYSIIVNVKWASRYDTSLLKTEVKDNMFHKMLSKIAVSKGEKKNLVSQRNFLIISFFKLSLKNNAFPCITASQNCAGRS